VARDQVDLALDANKKVSVFPVGSRRVLKILLPHILCGNSGTDRHFLPALGRPIGEKGPCSADHQDHRQGSSRVQEQFPPLFPGDFRFSARRPCHWLCWLDSSGRRHVWVGPRNRRRSPFALVGGWLGPLALLGRRLRLLFECLFGGWGGLLTFARCRG